MNQLKLQPKTSASGLSPASRLVAGLLLVSSLALAGCSLLGRGEALPLVTMRTPLPQIALCAAPMSAQIVVSAPDAGGGLNTDRIALLFDEREIKYLSSAKWDTAAPRLLQRQLVRYLDATGCFSGVGTETAGLSTRYRLQSDLERLHFRYGGDDKIPNAEIALRLTLINIDNGRVLGSKHIRYLEKCAGPNQNELLDAMDNVVYRAMLAAAQWTSGLVGADR